MDVRYLGIGKENVFSTKGVFLIPFCKEYQKKFGVVKMNLSCSSCKNTYWNKYTKLFIMSNKVECDYELKSMYNGITSKPNGNPIRNGEMTNAIAKDLISKHPKGEALFSKLPKIEKVQEAEKETIVVEAEKVEEVTAKKTRKKRVSKKQS